MVADQQLLAPSFDVLWNAKAAIQFFNSYLTNIALNRSF